MIGLDTNVLLRLLVDDDTTQAEASRELVARQRAEGDGKLLIRDIVLVELAWVMRKTLRLSRGEVVAAVERIVGTDGFCFERQDVLETAIHQVRDHGVDLADALIGLHNAADGCNTTWTFDRRAAELAEFTLVTPSGSA